MKTTPTFPAFPSKDTTGISIRQLFAMAAMEGLLSSGGSCDHPEKVANKAVEHADALVKALGND